MTCKAHGCTNTVLRALEDVTLCLQHFLQDVNERSRTFAQQLDDHTAEEPAREAALQFIVLTAAKIATIGTYSPPEEQLERGRLLNAMLQLADLRDRLDRSGLGTN
ncbi:MAG: hypothetical protein ACRD35_07755 [Candidatus Acidiferrales bacterium]